MSNRVGAAASDGAAPLARLSLNQITVDQWTLPEVVEGCVRAGITTIAPWREPVAEVGLDAAARLIADAGLSVSSLCRGGFFPAASEDERRRADDDNRRAVDEAAALGTDVLVLVCGPPRGRDLPGARAEIAAGVERLAPYAAQHGVRLGIEPLHPMMIGERSAIVTLGEAVDLALRFDADQVGVVVDAYHVWWDPALERELTRAAGRIVGFHVSDWLVPTPDLLQGRGMMGDGIIDLRRLRHLVEAAGYEGPIEVEVINRDLWRLPGDELVALTCERFAAAV
jgi:sugar phosphate isomerase/epimerase